MADSSPLTPVFVSIREAGIMLGVKRSTVYRLIESGKLSATKLGSRRLVIVASVLELADALARTE